MDGRCDNCDREDSDVVLVHRVYVVPEAWDTPGSRTRVEAPERWCFSCRSIYPHELAGEAEDLAGEAENQAGEAEGQAGAGP